MGSQDAARDQGDQRLPSEGEEEGRQEREAQEECWQPQVQGQVLKVPLHPQDHGQGEGRKAEAVSSSGSAGQGAQVKRTHVIDGTNFKWSNRAMRDAPYASVVANLSLLHIAKRSRVNK